jgi:prepilin-type N-terminal cleavage/methylation domain-containing protein
MLATCRGTRQERSCPRSPNPADTGFTLIELLIVVAIISIVAALATAGLLRSRITANEVSAIATMKVTVTAQKTFQVSCGRGNYASSYVILGTRAGSTEGFISSDLAAVAAPIKSGYTFNLTPGAGAAPGAIDCTGAPTVSTFYSTATPLSTSTGTRFFATNARAQIWQTLGGGPPAEPFGPPATPIQ